MPLKHYQERVLREVAIFLEALAAQQAAGNVKYAALGSKSGKSTRLLG
jgi:hypothetical protein